MENNSPIFPFLRKIEHKARGDKRIWIGVILLFIVSILSVYSTSGFLKDVNPKHFNNYLTKQLLFIAVGIGVVYIAHNINYMFYRKISIIVFVMAIFLLAYTFLFGVNINEGTRWVRIPGINLTFQTSDFAKTALVIFLARLLSVHQKDIGDFKRSFLPMTLGILATAALIAPSNLSTALIVVATGTLLLFIGRVRIKHLLILFFVAFILPMGLLVGTAVTHFDKEHGTPIELPEYMQVSRFPVWVKRVQMYLFEESHETMSYQNEQANIAIARGGLFGVGPGNSAQKYFLPLAYSDFIYAVIIEEYGLLMGVLVLGMYLYFLYRCIIIFRKCPNGFGAFLAIGLSLMLVVQAFVNILVNVGLLPTTGIGLPLISMGGSSYMLTCVSVGIILSVARNIETQEGSTESLMENEK